MKLGYSNHSILNTCVCVSASDPKILMFHEGVSFTL